MNRVTLIKSLHFHQPKNLCFMNPPSLRLLVLLYVATVFFFFIWYMAADLSAHLTVLFQYWDIIENRRKRLWDQDDVIHKNKTFHRQIRRYPPLPWSPTWRGFLRIDFLFIDQLLPRTFCLRHAAIRVYMAGKRKQSSTNSSITTQIRMTLRKPSLSSGLFWPVHGTPPTFMPKTTFDSGTGNKFVQYYCLWIWMIEVKEEELDCQPPVMMDNGRNMIERNER